MATITKSIGTTARDYSTITLWEAALGGAAGGGGNDAVGECYDDSAFDESPTINDATPDTITLSVASGERHDGTAGTGARIVRSAASDRVIVVTTTVVTVIEWLEVDHNGNRGDDGMLEVISDPASPHTFSQCLLHNRDAVDSGQGVSANGRVNVLNCFIYDFTTTDAGRTAKGIRIMGTRPQNASNNTLFNIVNDAGSQAVYGIEFLDDANHTVQNCIVCDTGGTTSGTKQDYSVAAPGTATVDHNLASDTTASGTGSLDSKAAADQFVSTSPVNLHLKTGADAIDAGTDLGTTPSGVEIDIDGRDRDAQGDTWDMGAHEFVSVAAGFVPYPRPRGLDGGMSIMNGGIAA